MQLALIITAWLLALAILALVWRRWYVAAESRRRLFDDLDEEPAAAPVEQIGWLRRWLLLAGYRSPAAPSVFVLSTLGGLAFGALAGGLVQFSGAAALMIEQVAVAPGGLGDLLAPVVLVMPWALLVMPACVPWLMVRRARRVRVQQIEQDLPLTLELFATLSEAGLGFDAALNRVLQTRLSNRPLAEQFRSFQADVLGGRPRVECLRRLARRIEVPAMTIFVSSLVQAEQLGMGVATVLRRQADDLRDRRRERANAFAAALPVKRLFPLVICFLPGLFVWTLGPFFLQLLQMADSFLQVRSF